MDARLSHGLTLALVFWGVIAPLVGILVGHYLSRSWQREQWFRDKRYEDYQAVLSATVAAYTAIIQVDREDYSDSRDAIRRGPNGITFRKTKMIQEIDVIKADSFRVLRDRIFIAEELDYGGILVEWNTIVTNYATQTSDEQEFTGRFTELNDKLVRMALNPPRHPGWFERWRLRRLSRKFSRELAKSNLQKL
ncbi:MAG: hypothetical protein ABSG00_11710 [Terracidiphilus sp.]|jgi:hypothetical protein